MDGQDIIALALTVAALAYVGRRLWRATNGRAGCGCVKTGEQSPRDRSIRRLPLVPLGQVGVPGGTSDGNPRDPGVTAR